MLPQQAVWLAHIWYWLLGLDLEKLVLLMICMFSAGFCVFVLMTVERTDDDEIEEILRRRRRARWKDIAAIGVVPREIAESGAIRYSATEDCMHIAE
ncbi:unnamed protein product, partial [Mesorhabditis spiculigera]